MQIEKTNRGFGIGEFKDAKNVECSIQESSLATEAAIWFGTQNADPKKETENGWEKVPIPSNIVPRDIFGNKIPVSDFGKSILFNTRMHLTQKHTKQLIKDFKNYLLVNKIRKRQFVDRYGSKCSIRTTDNLIELGCDDADPKVCIQGWQPVIFPEGTVFTTHMFLGKEEILILLPMLERFQATGYLRTFENE